MNSSFCIVYIEWDKITNVTEGCQGRGCSRSDDHAMPIFNIGGFTDIHMLTEPTIWGAEGELSENNEWPAKLKSQRRSHPKSCAGRMPIGDLRAFIDACLLLSGTFLLAAQ